MFASTVGAVDVGIGDDCAVLGAAAGRVVVSVDAHVEGAHFTRALMSLEDAGFRATMAALSDLAAMGATPLAVFGALGVPKDLSDEELYAVARGQAEAARRAGTAIAGGNLTSNPVVSITTTVIGQAVHPVLRSGARVGDDVLVGGELGWSAAGLAIAQARSALDEARAPTTADARFALSAFRRPEARISLGVEAARAGVTAMIDVSDGLAADAGHVARESGVDVCFDAAALEDARLADLVGDAAESLILSGGEDFALLATAPAGTSIVGMRRVGTCREARDEPGVYVVRAGAPDRRVDRLGFDHFR